jgi:hypothetical protein
MRPRVSLTNSMYMYARAMMIMITDHCKCGQKEIRCVAVWLVRRRRWCPSVSRLRASAPIASARLSSHDDLLRRLLQRVHQRAELTIHERCRCARDVRDAIESGVAVECESVARRRLVDAVGVRRAVVHAAAEGARRGDRDDVLAHRVAARLRGGDGGTSVAGRRRRCAARLILGGRVRRTGRGRSRECARSSVCLTDRLTDEAQRFASSVSACVCERSCEADAPSDAPPSPVDARTLASIPLGSPELDVRVSRMHDRHECTRHRAECEAAAPSDAARLRARRLRSRTASRARVDSRHRRIGST